MSSKVRLIIHGLDLTPAGLDQDQIWLILYGSVFVLILIAIAPGLSDLSKASPKCAMGIAAGGALLFAAGFVFEIIPSIKSLSFEPVLEETLELAAVVLIIWGAMRGLGPVNLVERDHALA